MMNGKILGDAIADAIVDGSATTESKAAAKLIWEKIAAEIVKHIQNNAEVPSGIPVSTTGSQVAQSGATTSAGKVQ